MDLMNSKERIKALILKEPIDRVPFMPFFVSYLAVDNDVSLKDFFSNPVLAFDAGESTMNRHPWANIRPVYGWGDHGAWEFGGKIAWPKDNMSMTPYTPEPLISSPEGVDSLTVPDPRETEWYRLRSEFNEICSRNGQSVQLPSGSILTQLASILEIKNLMKWIIKYPDALHRLAKKVLSFTLTMAEITIEKYGARDCTVMTDLATESNDLISPRVFEEFCLPYIKALHGFYYESGVRSMMIHLCGNHAGNLKYWKEIPIPERAIFSIGDSMNLEETGEILGSRYILAGNISTTTLQWGEPEDVKREVRRCLKQAMRRDGGFILMPACEWPPLAPRNNLDAVRDALIEDGFY